MENFDKANKENEIDQLLSELEDMAKQKLAYDDEQKARQIIEKQLAEITPEKGEEIKKQMLNKILRSMQEDDLDELADKSLDDEE